LTVNQGVAGSSPARGAIFKKGNCMQVRANANGKIGTCGCGRSPTGDCCGWHGLNEDAYKQALEQYNQKLNENKDSK
jgi:hypothetical protein